MNLHRRQFLSGVAAIPSLLRGAAASPPLCIFSKHLASLNYDELGKTAKQMGFNGVDLAVRPAGHVLPEKVSTDLPKAVEAIRGRGSDVHMITTGLTSGSDPAAQPTLSTASHLRIPFFKPGYEKYKGTDVEASLASFRKDVRSLAEVSRAAGMQMGLHNHSGDYLGEAVWDTRNAIEDLDAKVAGYYFDPCHATAEGGLYGWQNTLNIALPRLKMVAVKDFYWSKEAGNKWKMTMCPLGQGMVDWQKFFSRLAAAKFMGPISLHLEYQTPDEPAAMAKDLQFLRGQVSKAYGA